MNAVDTNVLIYSIDRNDPTKQAKAQRCLRGLSGNPDPTYLLWQVLGELVQQLRQWKDQGRITDAQFDQHVRAFRGLFPLMLPTPPVVDHALDLSRRYSLAHWDSMILGACKEAGITTLYTEDIGAPRVIDRIQLVNPLI